MGHLRFTIGYLKATVVHIRVTLGHLKVNYRQFFSELHPKVRPTCLICFMCGKDHHLSKIFDLLTMILNVRKYLIAKETLYVPTNILNSQRHVLLLQLTQLN